MSSLPPNAPPLRHQLDEQLLLGHAEEARHLAPVVEDALALRVAGRRRPSGSGSASALSGSRNRCSMRCVRQVPRDHVRARGERRVDVAAPDDRVRQQVLVLAG